jgi:uncharacterized protein YjbJ (UPF0337 family)
MCTPNSVIRFSYPAGGRPRNIGLDTATTISRCGTANRRSVRPKRDESCRRNVSLPAIRVPTKQRKTVRIEAEHMSDMDRAEHKGEELKGRTKEFVGDKTDNEDLANEGRGEQASAHVKQAGDKVRDAADHVKDAVKK